MKREDGDQNGNVSKFRGEEIAVADDDKVYSVRF
jgi:hypothetical protein